jgi:hypothetical protein
MDIRWLYYSEMGSRFPQLKLCELNWKAELIATVYYSPWYITYMKRKALEEQEGPGDGDGNDLHASGSQSKRSRNDSTTKAAVPKRLRRTLVSKY